MCSTPSARTWPSGRLVPFAAIVTATDGRRRSPGGTDRTVGYPRRQAPGCTSRTLFRRRDCSPAVRSKQKGADMPARIRRSLEARHMLLVLVAVVMPLVVLLSSSVGSAATKAAPANTALPAITGTAHAGQ